ncbi:TIGR03862 family flavoprotein [Sulfitobacter sp. S190]|uniref:TIGR03862 family flavoprotein n=1 Tax=Sulfitobacter sp. S190 TaxID=2867022 RepID=UPI0021A3B048|nr:TIGR03862 family flavoprotein [Sulfitobacter sp. S190]UWR22255.1 TIGR03862 family flavoprotein [Sulfitobacter sp. S190]
MSTAAVIGSGPAGLMAAERLAQAGVSVTIFEAKPSVGRKFLMAGKSGLNLTKVEEHARFEAAYTEALAPMQRMLDAFGAQEVQEWAAGLDEPLFTGSTGRVFPTAMKASPLLRKWLSRLRDLGVTVRTRMRWIGWQDGALLFATPDGTEVFRPDATVLALGGASWSRLGSDGAWAPLLAQRGVEVAAFAPANAALRVDWSDHMARFMGGPVKAIALRCGPYRSRGEVVVSQRGLEGGGVYSVSRGVREGHELTIDLAPDVALQKLVERLDNRRGKTSLNNHLRKAGRLDPVKIALLRDMQHPLPDDSNALAQMIKGLVIRHEGLRPMDEAISTAGGVRWSSVDEDLRLHAIPNTWVAGEMLDWEAPTGGYLITGCMATGAWAGQAAARALA